MYTYSKQNCLWKKGILVSTVESLHYVGAEAGFLVCLGYVPDLKYVLLRRKGMTLEKKCP
jgi:hypothetical protein